MTGLADEDWREKPEADLAAETKDFDDKGECERVKNIIATREVCCVVNVDTVVVVVITVVIVVVIVVEITSEFASPLIRSGCGNDGKTFWIAICCLR